MRNLILTTILLIGFLGYAQKPKVDALRYKEVTTTQRDAFVVPVGEHWKIYNTTTAQFEYWDGDSWEVVSSGSGHVIQDAGTPVTVRPNLNFNGSGVTVSDNAGNSSTDITINGATVSDAVYDGTWDEDTEGASKNALFDKIESVIAGVGTGATPETKTAVGGEATWIVTTPITSSHKLFVNGIKLIEGVSNDYTQTGSTFTFAGYSPVAGHEWEYYPDIAVPDGTEYVDLTSNQTKTGVLSFNNTSGVSTNGISIENSSATGTSYGLKVLNSNNSFDGQSGVLFENTGLGYAGITSIPSGNGGGQYILGNATYTGTPLKYQKTGGNSFTVDANANVTANSFIGDGSGLTNLPSSSTEGVSSTGTDVGGDLVVTLGSPTGDTNNPNIVIDQSAPNLSVNGAMVFYDNPEIQNNTGWVATLSADNLTENKTIDLNNITATSTASAVTTQIINLDNPSGDVYYTAEWNATYTTANLVGRGWVKIAIDTTGQTVFPTITGATLRTGADFVATETFDMIVGTDDGTNVYYYFLAR